VFNSNLGPILHDTLKAENHQFSLLHSHLALSLGVNPFEFLDEPHIGMTIYQDWGYPLVKVS